MPTPHQIDDACKRYTERFGVRVTPDAMQLIWVLLNAVENDPYPNWEMVIRNERYQSRLENLTENFARDLPGILDMAFNYAVTYDPALKERKVLTTFDLAHHMTWILSRLARVGGLRKL